MSEIMVGGRRELTTMQLGDYVHVAAQLEKDIYTMKETENRLRENAKDKEKDIWASPELELETPRRVPEFESDRSEAWKDFRKHHDKNYGFARALLIIFAVGIFAIGGFMLNYKNLDADGKDTPISTLGYPVALLSIPAGIVTGIVHAKICGKITSNRYEKFYSQEYLPRERRKHDDMVASFKRYNEVELVEINNKIKNDYEEELAETEAHNQKVRNTIAAFKKQAKDICEKRMQLEQLRNNFYSMGIIPPDYRTMDCIYVLDHIFRNGLADDMRQAINKYEEYVFRGDVVKGMSTIISSISSLRGQMSYLINDINSIRQEVNYMSQDIYRLADAQSAQNRSVDAILENSKATRYAAEAVQKHVERVEKYYR